MRVVAISDNPDRPERYLLAGLVRAGHEVRLLLGPDADQREFVALGVPCQVLSIRSRFDLRAIRAIRSVLAEFQPEIVHAFTARGLCVLNLAALGRSVGVVGYRGTSGHLSRLDPVSWLGYLSPKVGAISCVSDAVRRYLRGQGVSNERLHVIYKGHRPEWYRAAPRSIWRELRVPDGAPIIVCVANARPVKGVDVLLKSLALLRSKVHVALIGEIRDPLLQGLIDQQREMVTSLGFRTDATALLGAADLLVVPSRSREGLPKAMMEAMAQGVPVIVTNVGGMPEIVRDGVDGVVVPPEDPAALAGAIDRLVADPSARGAIGMAGQRRVVEQFGADQLVAKTLAMYQGLLTR